MIAHLDAQLKAFAIGTNVVYLESNNERRKSGSFGPVTANLQTT